jgi:hypothetical protein
MSIGGNSPPGLRAPRPGCSVILHRAVVGGDWRKAPSSYRRGLSRIWRSVMEARPDGAAPCRGCGGGIELGLIDCRPRQHGRGAPTLTAASTLRTRRNQGNCQRTAFSRRPPRHLPNHLRRRTASTRTASRPAAPPAGRRGPWSGRRSTGRSRLPWHCPDRLPGGPVGHKRGDRLGEDGPLLLDPPSRMHL